MLSIRSGHTPKPRGFDYQPRFHDPEAEKRRKRQLQFVRPSERRQYKTKQPQFIAIGLGLALALYIYINIGTVAERVASFSGWFFGG